MKIATGSFTWLLVANLSVSAEPSSSDDYVSEIDKILDTRSQDAHKLEQWFHFYSVGKADEADKIWAAILRDMDKAQSIANFLERVNSRCWFAEEKSATKSVRRARLDPARIYAHLLTCTEKKTRKGTSILRRYLQVSSNGCRVMRQQRYREAIKLYLELLRTTGRDTDAKRIVASTGLACGTTECLFFAVILHSVDKMMRIILQGLNMILTVSSQDE